jgi:hypothetical protein
MHVHPSSLALFAALATASGLCAADSLSVMPVSPHCSPDQVIWQDVISHRCKLVPETKQIKKTIYEVQEVPFCLKKLPPLLSLFHHHGCGECEMCAECDCPRYKKVLVKKEVVCKEICGTKCVIEEFIERVPCRVGAPCQSQ